MKIIGIDLAWQSETNTTALAVGNLTDGIFNISDVYASLTSLDSIKDTSKLEAKLVKFIYGGYGLSKNEIATIKSCFN